MMHALTINIFAVAALVAAVASLIRAISKITIKKTLLALKYYHRGLGCPHIRSLP